MNCQKTMGWWYLSNDLDSKSGHPHVSDAVPHVGKHASFQIVNHVIEKIQIMFVYMVKLLEGINYSRLCLWYSRLELLTKNKRWLKHPNNKLEQTIYQFCLLNFSDQLCRCSYRNCSVIALYKSCSWWSFCLKAFSLF